jgi:hypothetical protein
MREGSDPLQVYCRQWITTYNQFQIAVLALKLLRCNNLPHAGLREEVVRTARTAIEFTVVLDSLHYRPMMYFQPVESRIWQAAMAVVNSIRWSVPPTDLPFETLRKEVESMDHAWQRFLSIVDNASQTEIGETSSFRSENLESHGVQQILGVRCSAPAHQNTTQQTIDECVHQLVSRRDSRD